MLSHKESRKFAAVAEALGSVGIAAVRFDFSGCGESSPAPVGGALVPSRLRDLHAVIDHALGEIWSRGGVGLMGSSLGGYLALLAAAGRLEVRATVCWATPYDLGRIQAALTGSQELIQHFPPGFKVGEPLDLSELSGPCGVLVIHGLRDETVPWTDAGSIHGRVGEPRRLMFFEQADHRFLDEDCRQLAIRATVDWFLEMGVGVG
jgi:pimeloyl-ACP methyl ester carboxylesterase